MSSARDPHSILNRNPDLGLFKVPQAKPKVTRYYPGVIPASENDQDDDIFEGLNDFKSLGDTSITSEKMMERLRTIEEVSRPVRQSEKTETRKKKEEGGKREEERRKEGGGRKREDGRKEGMKEEERREERGGMEEEEGKRVEAKINVENVEVRTRGGREALKAKLLEKEEEEERRRGERKRVEEEVEEEEVLEEEEKDEERENEEEGEEDEEEEGYKPLTSILKPVFVSKNDRDGNDRQILEDIALEEEAKKIKEKKKIEAKILVSEAIKAGDNADDEEAMKSNSEQGMPDDNDDNDAEQELEAWKIRELLRLKNEREERTKHEKEMAEIERRRRLTDEERTKENMLLGSDATDQKEKTKYRFMQKYYHKGAFFNDSDDSLLKRDYNVAVGEDLFDKSNLPSILWRRRGEFGKKGQSKYTHLTDQDTTDFNPEWKVDEALREKMYGKMAGLKGRDVMERKDLRKMKL